jgi:hypothetical protein
MIKDLILYAIAKLAIYHAEPRQAIACTDTGEAAENLAIPV